MECSKCGKLIGSNDSFSRINGQTLCWDCTYQKVESEITSVNVEAIRADNHLTNFSASMRDD